jgi:hypothetical protein
MTDKEKRALHDDLVCIRQQLHYALDNIDSISRRKRVTGALEFVVSMLDDFCEMTKGEMK